MSVPVEPVRRSRIWITIVVLVIGVGLVGVLGYYQWSVGRTFANAQDAITQGELKRADSLMRKCLEAWPNNGEVSFWAARLARKRGDYPEAQRRLKQAQDRGWVPEAIQLEEALIDVQRGRLAAREAYLTYCIDHQHPDCCEILEVLAPAYHAQFQLERALEYGRQWSELQPERISAWQFVARIAEQVVYVEEAKRAYLRILELKPNDSLARLGVATMLFQQNRGNEALPLVEQLHREQPYDRDITFILAKGYRVVGDADQARPLFEALLKERPRDKVIAAELAQLELDAGNPHVAEPLFRMVIDQPPYEPVVLHNFALCLERNGKSDEAAKVREQFKQADADKSRLRELVDVIGVSPKDPTPRREAGIVMLRNHFDREGLRWLLSALEVAPDDRATHLELAKYYEGKDAARANYHREQAAKSGNSRGS